MTLFSNMSDEEWQRILPMFPELHPRSELRGRPLSDTRAVLNGVLWVMFYGASWSAMPRIYPPYQTCHRRFKKWHESGVFKRVVDDLFGEASTGLFSSMEERMRVRSVVRREITQAQVPASFSSHFAYDLASAQTTLSSEIAGIQGRYIA